MNSQTTNEVTNISSNKIIINLEDLYINEKKAEEDNKDDEISTSPYYVNIKKMLEAGAKVHSYQSIVDLTLEELDKLKDL